MGPDIKEIKGGEGEAGGRFKCICVFVKVYFVFVKGYLCIC